VGLLCATVNVPDFGCFETPVSISAVPGTGSWTSSDPAAISFVNAAAGSTSFTSTQNGEFDITWTAASGNCTISKKVTIVGPAIADIPEMPRSMQTTLCGPSGEVNMGVKLIGDSTNGNWTSNIGTFENSASAFTLFTWDRSGTVELRFAPNSVCPTPATRSIEIAAECPPEPLSREATIGIAVGATIGGLILIAAAIVATIMFYRYWNQNRVKFRHDEGAESHSYYKL
jgi:hypothetical protein